MSTDAISPETIAANLPYDVLEKILECHVENWEKTRVIFPRDWFPKELTDMEHLIQERIDSGEESVYWDDIPDIDWAIEAVDCMRIWFRTRDEEETFAHAHDVSDLGDLCAFISQLEGDHAVWLRFKKWAIRLLISDAAYM